MEIRVANCPFCSSPISTVTVSEDWGYFWVQCPRTSCRTLGPVVDPAAGKDFIEKGKMRAIKKWNAKRRTFIRKVRIRVKREDG